MEVWGGYLSDMALGEALALAALLPLAAVVSKLVEEARFVRNVRKLNADAGVAPPPRFLGLF